MASNPNSSSSTLAHGPEAPPGVPQPSAQSHAYTPSTPHSPGPFSPSFDPNVPTPAAHITPVQLYPFADAPATPYHAYALHPQLSGYAGMGAMGAGPGFVGTDAANALWAHRLSASFGAIADQISQASKALAPSPMPTPSSVSSTHSMGVVPRSSSGPEVVALATRMDIIERAQEQLARDVQAVQAQMARTLVTVQEAQAAAAAAATGNVNGSAVSKRQSMGQVDVVEVNDGIEEVPQSEFKSATEIAVEELQRKVEGIIDTIKLDQSRLYARLHNATITSNKMTIMAPATAAGKAPPNFPTTKGEFEHLTKERYEAILKAYNVPAKGDTATKRETLREFIGLTPAAH
ncbi:uncharacterized protein BXZ73DRAFT_54048 [Epithele typhae]|uniref:uncharacterized protein n=1 Tax=Epithele typhae TaxID=378194 RepID=UPI0020082E3B|nr:uncharacterized protein BXZ73DRAFT_54048 [Epithele typhae]KAH9915935.1 hypothetical protein BXZ73DRAFT_54048 [Epithele typhae]